MQTVLYFLCDGLSGDTIRGDREEALENISLYSQFLETGGATGHSGPHGKAGCVDQEAQNKTVGREKLRPESLFGFLRERQGRAE